jgi:hypothetical protein
MSSKDSRCVECVECVEEWDERLVVWWPSRFMDKGLSLGVFLQRMANRLITGAYRYDKGKPGRQARYLTRLEMEIAEYRQTGNKEHLINAANYCFLEFESPELESTYWDANAKSVTRRKLRSRDKSGRKT